MIINRPGATFTYDDIVYTLGEKIYANGASDYSGLVGQIYEIRDGEDKETDNEGPDFYCSFEVPISPHEVSKLEKRFAALYQTKKSLEDITLDMVIMAPEMVIPLKSLENGNRKMTLYVVQEKWANNGESGCSFYPFSDYEDAKAMMLQLLSNEAKDGGLIKQWCDSETFQTDSGSHFYECWNDGFYNDSHYHVSIVQETLHLSEKSFGMIGRAYADECYRGDFIEQIEPWEELSKLTDEQRKALFSDPDVPERIHHALGMNDSYWESYWLTVSEVAHEIVQKHMKENSK